MPAPDPLKILAKRPWQLPPRHGAGDPPGVGADVVINYVSHPKPQQVVQEIQKAGVRSNTPGRCSGRSGCRHAHRRSRAGTIDILVSNAGLQWIPFWEMTLEQWNTVIGINHRSPLLPEAAWFVLRCKAQLLCAGKIICMSSHQDSWAGTSPMPLPVGLC